MLSDNIRTVRKNKGLTQEDLASRIHVTRQTVSKWEKGISVPDAEMLTRLAEELETDVRKLDKELKEYAETHGGTVIILLEDGIGLPDN